MTITELKRKNSPHQPVGRWISKPKRLAIYMRDGFCCVLCQRDLHAEAPRDITLDHHIPRSMGGDNEAGNLYTCCRECNQGHRHQQRTWAQIRRVVKHLRTPLHPFLSAALVVSRHREQVSRAA